MFFLPHGGTGAELLFKSSPANDGEDGDYRSGKSPFSGLLYRNIPGQAASGANSDKPLPDDAVCVQYAAVFYCVYLYAFRKETFQISVLLAAGFLSFLPMLFPGLYGKAAVGLWAAVLLGAAALMATEIIYLTKELDRGEKICWN